jgi:hypothetical protein
MLSALAEDMPGRDASFLQPAGPQRGALSMLLVRICYRLLRPLQAAQPLQRRNNLS